VVARLVEQWSPEQIAGRLKKSGELRISHETIYRRIWEDWRRGGHLYLHLRGAQKKRRKRYGRYDSRGRLAGKRMISERPPGAENRSRVGHLEGDTVLGSSDKHCVLTLVDRKTGYVMIGKLESRTTEATNRRAVALISKRRPSRPHHHRRQRHRIPRLQGRRGRHRCAVLLRDAASFLGTWHLREYQWPHPPVPTQAQKHGSRLPARLRPHRMQTQ
jgi:IS30 family transposase